jgi:hypothetical protein
MSWMMTVGLISASTLYKSQLLPYRISNQANAGERRAMV